MLTWVHAYFHAYFQCTTKEELLSQSYLQQYSILKFQVQCQRENLSWKSQFVSSPKYHLLKWLQNYKHLRFNKSVYVRMDAHCLYLINPFCASVPLLYPQKFSDNFRGYRNGTLAWNGLNNCTLLYTEVLCLPQAKAQSENEIGSVYIL